MVAVISLTDKYILQPALLDKHRQTLEWLSAAALWKKELTFFQKLLDQYSLQEFDYERHKKIGHFQSMITYYNAEIIGSLTSYLRLHEKKLAQMLASKGATKTEYFKEHDDLMRDAEAISIQFIQNKEDLLAFFEKML